MSTPTVTLSSFILARVDEDEADANEPDNWNEYDPGSAFDPARVLALCKAHRAIVEVAWSDHLRIESEWGMNKGRAALEADDDYPEAVLALAQVWADHPDFDNERWGI